jgi:hypothetical protein
MVDKWIYDLVKYVFYYVNICGKIWSEGREDNEHLLLKVH